MASATQSTIEEPDTRLSTTFYAELLKTGVFSDITFKYGKQHTFKLHSVVLKPKSTWFATHCKDNSKQMSHNIDIFDDGLSIECLNNFNPRLIEHCSEHAAGDRCISADHFTSLLEFCYLNNYPPQLWTGIGRQTLCFSHIYMYCLAKRFGVDSLLVLSATGFAHTMSLLLLENKNETAFIRFINLVYDLPVLEEDDLLRVKARQQAAKFAGGEFIRLRNSFVKGVKQSRVTKAMPKAGQDLLTCSLSSDVFDLAQPIPDEPSTPEVSTKAHTCVRCTVSLNAGAASPDSKLCDKCKPKAHSCSNVALPPSRGNTTGPRSMKQF
ncbi:hypothetical protein P153DRAFT_390824 [Dothidotthia symphoricarpi CBS 119687]|uniref:BTB domain-containing protein n=1 Tax=Dothidotthia symphoricarpi CBS 119687 TaxID=1392245 RepID=A0A6A5ZWY7_9PLEO|nr:uncharacterized protein P153DRAFT_390824 [Dothidotthia symphoricarpi CBS 119687]KAF2124272.1 hypothetical protein P153DRAFT_390824 [Dothidotthia symphoricarpi CBS 119687]